jgi:uncharacterized protein DUF6542
MPDSWDGALGALRGRPAAGGAAGPLSTLTRRDEPVAGGVRAPVRPTGMFADRGGDTTSGGQGGPAGSPVSGQGSGSRAGARPAIRLTGRGGVVAIFVLSFAGAFFASVLHFGPLAGCSYVAGCVLAAALVRRSQLLLVAVTPPMLFSVAVVCTQLLTASGGTLSAIGGTVVTLGNVAPWLFAGTAIGVVIALARGLAGNVRELRRALRGDPARPDGLPGRKP